VNILYVEDQLVDLGSATISITIKAIEVGKIQVRSVNYTNSFTVPDTENNDIILGYAKDEKSRTSKPYRLLSFKLVQNGIESFKGKAVIKSFKGGYKLQLFEDVYDIFNAINDKPFKQLETFESGAWNPSDIDTARLNTEGLISALIDWGREPFPSQIYESAYFLPSFFYHTTIKSILQTTGLSLSGDILTDARFTDLVIPFPGDNFDINEEDTDLYDVDTVSPGQSVLSPTTATGVKVNWTDEGLIYLNDYTPPDSTVDIVITVSVTLDINTISYFNATGFYAKLILYRSAAETVIATTALIDSGYGSSPSVTLTENITIQTGDLVYVKVYSNSNSSPTITFTIANTSTISVIGTNSIGLDYVDWNNLWPDITCKELLQDFLTRFNIIMKQKQGVLYLKTLEEIIGNRFNVMDWSDKLVKSDIDMDFTLSMNQLNHLDYNNQTVDDSLGRGTIVIDNTTLPFENTIYTSPFENCEAFDNGYYNIASIPVFDEESTSMADFKNSPGLKLCTLKARTTEPTFEFDEGSGNSRSDYKLAYFVDETKAKDTGFQYFVNQFYPKYEQALQRSKIIVKRYLLTELDIQNYDPHKLMYDGEDYYLVNTIKNFVSDKITQVELFKGSSSPVVNPVVPPIEESDFLLLETGDYYLQEDDEYRFKLE